MKRTKIISAFPGTGKSHYHKLHPETTLDSDSSEFSWIKDKNGNNTNQRNPEFPKNYMDHIKDNIGKYEIIFVSSHEVVREALKDNCLFYYMIYPRLDAKETYLKRFKTRGSPDGFISLLDEKWDDWLKAAWPTGNDEDGVVGIQIPGDEYLGSIINLMYEY